MKYGAVGRLQLIKQIYRGQTTIAEAARNNDITQQEIERWMDEPEIGMESALKAIISSRSLSPNVRLDSPILMIKF